MSNTIRIDLDANAAPSDIAAALHRYADKVLDFRLDGRPRYEQPLPTYLDGPIVGAARLVHTTHRDHEPVS